MFPLVKVYATYSLLRYRTSRLNSL
ncbi:protein of unknown function [Paraburkholderia kururiensis]